MTEFLVRHPPERLGALYRELAARGVGRLRRGAWAVLVVCVCGVALAVGPAWPWVGVAGISIAIAVGLDVLGQQQIATALAMLEAIGPQGLRYRVDSAGIAETSALSQVQMPWSSFTGRREIAGHLVLDRIPARAGLFVALPLDQLPPQARSAIEAQVPATTDPKVG